MTGNMRTLRSPLQRAFVFSIQGPHAVGKSSLLRQLSAAQTQLRICHETVAALEEKKVEDRLDMSILEDFCTNQRRFIRWEIARYESYGPQEVVVVDRGPDSTEFFSTKYPEIMRMPWDSAAALDLELRALRRCRADRLLYLWAPERIIRERASRDDRIRPTLDRWLKRFEPKAEEWFRQRAHCDFLDTSAMSQTEVRDWVLEWVRTELCAAALSAERKDHEFH